jgi:hypothetical protein
MSLRALSTAALLFLAHAAHAGITIHYEGRADGASSIEKMAAAVCEKASQFGWACKSISGRQIGESDQITAKFVSELEGGPDLGNARGIVVYPHPMCEPLYLVAGPSGRMKNFVKTQFAGAEVHVKVVEILEVAKANLVSLQLEDESGFADSKDRKKLESELEGVHLMMAKIQRENSGVRGPVKRPDGRILDLVRDR